jgi:hypothetical protein
VRLASRCRWEGLLSSLGLSDCKTCPSESLPTFVLFTRPPERPQLGYPPAIHPTRRPFSLLSMILIVLLYTPSPPSPIFRRARLLLIIMRPVLPRLGFFRVGLPPELSLLRRAIPLKVHDIPVRNVPVVMVEHEKWHSLPSPSSHLHAAAGLGSVSHQSQKPWNATFSEPSGSIALVCPSRPGARMSAPGVTVTSE